MSDDIKRSRGRPKKDYISEQNNNINNQSSAAVIDSNYEFNSFSSTGSSLEDILGCSITSFFTPEDIKKILKDPITNHSIARKLAMFVYNTEGVVTNSIDYMTALPCLDRIVFGKSKHKKLGKNKLQKNKELMLSVLKQINDKQFFRDALFAGMNEGTVFYYFDITTSKVIDKTKFLNDWDVENIVEINDLGINVAVITLPYDYCKVVGMKNGRFVIAFNLEYFDEKSVNETDKTRKLKKFPKEIQQGYHQWEKGRTTGNNWIVLDNDKTIVHKIKCKVSEPWGRPLAIAAIADILYEDEFVDTKRGVLREINNKVVYQTLPEGKEKGSCALTKKQQENQHNTVKSAVMQKNSRNGISFFTVSAGTKMNVLDVQATDIFDVKNENNLTDKIAMDMGMAAQLIGATSSGTFAAGQHNLDMIFAQIYSWIQYLQSELNYIINKNIIKDKNNPVETYYLPTSLVNRKNFFEMMKDLYLSAGGSMTMFVAASGMSPEAYYAVLDEEIDNNIFDKYEPHKTSYVMSSKDNNKGGRPETDNPTENTIKSRNNNGNALPSASDNN